MQKGLSIAIALCGMWLLATALSFGPRDPLIFFNDLSTGAALVILSALSFVSCSRLYFFPLGLLGTWLNLAPLVFWAPTGFDYLNDTFIGLIVLLCAFQWVAPAQAEGVPPPGWSFNPSAWRHRRLIIFLAAICFFLARYLACFELGYLTALWDPLGEGTARVLHSKISRSLPVPDAGVGAFAYGLETILSWQGGENRWKQAPWLVLSFGVLTVPVGIVSVFLMSMQPLAVEAWCFLCLVIAFCMLWIVNLSVPEVLATLQCLRGKRGASLWHALFYGVDETSPTQAAGTDRILCGVSSVWNQYLLIALSLAYTIYLGFQNSTDLFVRIASVLGAFVFTFAILSMAEALRAVRYLICLLGIALVALSFVYLWGAPILMTVSVACGVVFTIAPFPKGRIREQYDRWNRFIV